MIFMHTVTLSIFYILHFLQSHSCEIFFVAMMTKSCFFFYTLQHPIQTYDAS